MTTTNDWNASVVAEFRANGGVVASHFASSSIVLLHHVGRTSGTEYLAPVMYQASEDPDTIYVIASAGGAPENPQWYRNTLAAGTATVEVGTQTYDVTVAELHGAERDSVFAEQAGRYPRFAEYAVMTQGIRTIPVLALTRKA